MPLKLLENPNVTLPPLRDSVIICGSCAKGFNNEDLYQEHTQTEQDSSLITFKCRVCEYKSKTENELRTHQDDVHGNTCSIEINSNRLNTTPHEVPNMGCIQCPLCYLSSKNQDTLKKHILNIHCTNNKKITSTDNIETIGVESCSKCTRCEFIGSKTELENHLRTNHGNTVSCYDCSKTFPDERTLEKHMETGHRVEPFPCEFCGLILADF